MAGGASMSSVSNWIPRPGIRPSSPCCPPPAAAGAGQRSCSTWYRWAASSLQGSRRNLFFFQKNNPGERGPNSNGARARAVGMGLEQGSRPPHSPRPAAACHVCLLQQRPSLQLLQCPPLLSLSLLPDGLVGADQLDQHQRQQLGSGQQRQRVQRKHLAQRLRASRDNPGLPFKKKKTRCPFRTLPFVFYGVLVRARSKQRKQIRV